MRGLTVTRGPRLTVAIRLRSVAPDLDDLMHRHGAGRCLTVRGMDLAKDAGQS